MKKFAFKAGEIIFNHGEPASEIYLLISGEVGLYFSTDLAHPYITIRENETFGEMGVIDNELRQSRSRCLSDCEVIKIEREVFLSKYEGTDTLIKVLIKSLSMRLRDANKKIMKKA